MASAAAAFAPILLLLAVFAGCASVTTPGTELPSDWKRGAVLKPYQMGSTHNGAHDADLYPLDRPGLAEPASCKAYRDNRSQDSDSCEIRAPRYSWEDEGSWVISARWAECPSARVGHPCNPPVTPYEPRVVAFDSGGRAVSWWDGTPGPKTAISTE